MVRLDFIITPDHPSGKISHSSCRARVGVKTRHFYSISPHSNGHGKDDAPENTSRRARFLHPNHLMERLVIRINQQAGKSLVIPVREEAGDSQHEFHVNLSPERVKRWFKSNEQFLTIKRLRWGGLRAWMSASRQAASQSLLVAIAALVHVSKIGRIRLVYKSFNRVDQALAGAS